MTGYLGGAEWAAALANLGDTPGKQRCESPLSKDSGPVCLTGVTGFLALELARQLLEKGYTVIGTVRSQSNAAKMAPVVALQEKFGKDRLRIVAGVDCLKPETFGDAVKDCVGVFHTASPFHFNTEDPIKDIVEPAKIGTEACLVACKAAGSVKRVVVTSSFAAINNPGGYPGDYQYTAKDWNKTSFPDSQGKFTSPVHGYLYSKTLAEKVAWDFAAAEDCAFDVATINPPLIIGTNANKPTSVDDLNTSSALLMKILLGQMDTEPGSDGWVDVADVARAHIVAYEHVEAGGRRFPCTADEIPTFTDVAKLLKELRPDCPVKCEPPADGEGERFGLDNSGLKSLGMSFTPLKDIYRVQIESLVELGFVAKAPGGLMPAWLGGWLDGLCLGRK